MTIPARTAAAFLITCGLLYLPGAGAAPAGESKAAQVARGAQAWQANCGRCHNLRDPQDLTDEEWEVSVTHMRVRANIPGPVAESIKAFLKSSN